MEAFRRGGRQGGQAGRAFPGEASWRWHVQLARERAISPLRAAVFAVTCIAWLSMPAPSRASSHSVATVALIALAFVVIDLFAVFRASRLIARAPWVSVAMDFALITSWLEVTKSAGSPFAALAFLGALGAPLRLSRPAALFASTAYGVMLLVQAGAQHWYDAVCVFLTGIAMTLWTSTANRERRAGLRDDLTGCFSREYANFRLADLYARSAFPLSVAIVDLDGFKQINDTFGHAAGDALLVQAVRAISGAIRHGDLLARSGGDEFVLVLPRADAQLTYSVAERVRRGIERTRYRLQSKIPVRVTASIGAAIAADPSVSLHELIAQADERLYAAKQAGRNRVNVG
jgi:diguanylate cyclase (GGDEF)-like protein